MPPTNTHFTSDRKTELIYIQITDVNYDIHNSHTKNAIISIHIYVHIQSNIQASKQKEMNSSKIKKTNIGMNTENTQINLYNTHKQIITQTNTMHT